MANKPGGKATLQNVEDFLYELGPVRNDMISFRKVDFEVSITREGLEIYFDHPGSSKDLNHFKTGVIVELKQQFDGLDTSRGVVDSEGFRRVKFVGKQQFINFVAEEEGGSSAIKGKVIPTRIQEEGSTIIFNRALRDNVEFNKEDDILNDQETNRQLTKLFGPKWGVRLKDWTWTYFQQQKQWLSEYSGREWDEFRYDNQSFVKFFEKHMKNLRRDHDPKIAAGKYETWNPSDIWAVKGMNKVKDQIKKSITPKHQHLAELNALLINLMESEELVGISLKKVAPHSDAEIHLHNVETSSALKSLHGVSKMEKYGMNDIKFNIDNIWTGDAVTTTVKIGPSDDYKINITRAGNNLSFNTAIKRTPAAQGGQAPVDMVIKMLKGKEFKKNHTNYPQTPEKLLEESTKYENFYKLVSKHGNKAPSYNDFLAKIIILYKKSKKNAIAKLMLLTFWYDALTNYSKDNDKSAEFWTDLLYTGMKVTSKGEFAPHAKIS